MSKPSEQYKILDSLKVNPKCFFVLDDFTITDDIQVEMVARLSKEVTGIAEARFYQYGSQTNGTSYHIFILVSSNKVRFFTGSAYWETTAGKFDIYQKLKMVKKYANNITDVIVTKDDGTVVYSVNRTTLLNSSVYPFKLFGGTDTNATFEGLFYSFKVAQQGETIYDLVPAMRIADGELGLLNKVDGKFYENQGSGILERGEENA